MPTQNPTTYNSILILVKTGIAMYFVENRTLIIRMQATLICTDFSL